MKGTFLARAGMAVSLLALYFSGFGQMPVYQRYYVTEIPGLAWSAQYFLTLQVHYFFAVVLIFLYTFQLIRRWQRGKPIFTEQSRTPGNYPFAKLLRFSQIFIHLNILLLIGSGIVKTIQNLPTVNLPYPLLLATTTLHNLAAVLLLFSFAVFFLARLRQYSKKVPAKSGTAF